MSVFLHEYGKMIVIIIVIAALISVGAYFITTVNTKEIKKNDAGKDEATVVNNITTMNQLNEEGLDDWNEPWGDPKKSVPSHE